MTLHELDRLSDYDAVEAFAWKAASETELAALSGKTVHRVIGPELTDSVVVVFADGSALRAHFGWFGPDSGTMEAELGSLT